MTNNKGLPPKEQISKYTKVNISNRNYEHCKHVVMFTNKRCLHCILMREGPILSMCRHANEEIPSTEHVQMLHWACADIIMRGNPLTDMTDNTENANTN